MGMVNASVWIFGSLILRPRDLNIFIGWMFFCLILNLGISLSIAQKRTWRFQKLFWVTGIALIMMVLGAVIGSIWLSHGVKDWALLGFVFGGMQGGVVGLIIGFIVGLVTSPKDMKNLTGFQTIILGTSFSVFWGCCITTICTIIFAITSWLSKYNNIPYHPDLSINMLFMLFFLIPLGIVPSIGTGFSTTLAVYATTWWLRRKSVVPINNAG